jgi:hypothetical protein
MIYTHLFKYIQLLAFLAPMGTVFLIAWFAEYHTDVFFIGIIVC